MNKGKYSEFREFYERKSDIFCLKQRDIGTRAEDGRIIFNNLESALAMRVMGDETINGATQYGYVSNSMYLDKNNFYEKGAFKIDLFRNIERATHRVSGNSIIFFDYNSESAPFGELDMAILQSGLEYPEDLNKEVMYDLSYYGKMAFLALAPKEAILSTKETMAKAIDRDAKEVFDMAIKSQCNVEDIKEVGENFVELKSCLCVLVDRYQQELGIVQNTNDNSQEDEVPAEYQAVRDGVSSSLNYMNEFLKHGNLQNSVESESENAIQDSEEAQ